MKGDLKGLYDEDGIDGPWERAMAKPIVEHPTDAAAWKYFGSLRNRAKRIYAEKYHEYLKRGGEHSGDEPPRHTLTVMGAQAVRLRLAAIHGNSGAK